LHDLHGYDYILRMDRLTVMRSLVAVVRGESFASAARSLGISRALVSRHIADLEQQVGLRLVNRTTRAVSLTEAGHRYYEFSRRILSEIEDEESAIRALGEKPEGALAVNAPKWIGSLDLGEAICAFSVAHPLIKVRFEVGGLTERTYDFLDDGFDVAFYTKYLRDSSIMVKKVATLEFVLCASPDFLNRHGPLEDPNSLGQFDALIHVTDPVWHFQQGPKKINVKPNKIAFSSNTYLILQKAVMHGLGIALLPRCSVHNELERGALVPLLTDYQIPERPLYAAYSPSRQTARKVRVFLDFVANWFSQQPLEAAYGRRRKPLVAVS
jgi:DNA-binding transcriptional LysR family regulator